MPREWDANTYDEVARPHRRWATEVADRVQLAGDEVVLDAGAGTGRLSEVMLERLPEGRLVAVDGSHSMLELLEQRLGNERIVTMHHDLLDPLPVTVDVVVSSATFHWIHDHERLFANLAASLSAGGQLVAQCGGENNIAGVQAALDRVRGRSRAPSWYYATVTETIERLTAAGYADVEVWTNPDPVRIDAGAELETYLRTVVLGGELEAMPVDEHASFVAEVASAMAEPVIDYVRLNLVARRG